MGPAQYRKVVFGASAEAPLNLIRVDATKILIYNILKVDVAKVD